MNKASSLKIGTKVMLVMNFHWSCRIIILDDKTKFYILYAC